MTTDHSVADSTATPESTSAAEELPAVPPVKEQTQTSAAAETPTQKATVDEPQAAEESDEEQDERELTPGEAFTARLIILLATLSNRQSELLRMSEYFDDRTADLHDAKMRAKRWLEHELAEVDENALDDYLRIVQSIDAVESMDETEEAGMNEALAEIGRELPEGIEQTYVQAVVRARRPSLGPGFLHSSLLMIVVAEIEMFINQLARACFEVRPGALDRGDKTVRWSEISRFDTIHDVRDWLVDDIVEDLLRGSMLDWVKFFENRFNIPEIKSARSYAAMEAVQRRHCVAHNAGMASQQYLDHLADFKLSVKVNDDLIVDSDYLARAADTLYLVGYSLIWALGVKLNPEKDAITPLIDALTNRTMYLLGERRFDLVRQIVGSAPLNSLKGEDGEYCALVLQVNGWIAAKEMGQFDSVRQEVEQFPVATRANTFKLAKLALLDQDADALELTDKMIRDGELEPSFLLTWPLLRGVRRAARARDSSAHAASSDTVARNGEESK